MPWPPPMHRVTTPRKLEDFPAEFDDERNAAADVGRKDRNLIAVVAEVGGVGQFEVLADRCLRLDAHASASGGAPCLANLVQGTVRKILDQHEVKPHNGKRIGSPIRSRADRLSQT
jgi:hypothetical protein